MTLTIDGTSYSHNDNISILPGTHGFVCGSANARPAASLSIDFDGTNVIADNASAMIQGPDGSTQYFKVGSSVFNRASLQAVYDDRVVLSRDEQLETLYFPLPGTDSSDQPLASVNIPSNIQELVKDTMSLEEISQARRQLTNPKITPKQRQDLIKKRLQELRSRAKQIKDNR